MNGFPTAADIFLKVRVIPLGQEPGGEGRISLATKMDVLLSQGYEMDDLLGLAIPLLMEGKVRMDLDDGGSERMEMDSELLRFPRPAATAIFEEYAASKKDVPPAPRRPHSETMLIRIPKKLV